MATDESETLTNGETTETAASQPKRYLPLTLADAGWLTEATAPDVSLPALLHTLDTVESSAKMATAAVFYCSGLILIYARDHEDEWSAYTRQMQPPISVEGKQPVGGIEAEIGEMMLRRDYDYDDLGPAAKRGRRLSYARRAEYMADAIAKLDITTDTHFQIVADAVDQGWKAVEKEVATRRIENNRKSSAQQGVETRRANKEAREAAKAEAERVKAEEDARQRQADEDARLEAERQAAQAEKEAKRKRRRALKAGEPLPATSEADTVSEPTTATEPGIIFPTAPSGDREAPEAPSTATPISVIYDRLADAKASSGDALAETIAELLEAEKIPQDTTLPKFGATLAVQLLANGGVIRFTLFDDDALVDAVVKLIEEHREDRAEIAA